MKLRPEKMEVRLVSKKRCLCWGILGIAMLVMGASTLLLNPLKHIIDWRTRMTKGSFAESLWKDLPVEIINYMYVFNITNKERFLSGEDKKLAFEEVGPYVYKEVRTNENITFNDNGTMTYVPNVTVHFMEDRSFGNIHTDVVNIPNIPLLGTVSINTHEPKIRQFGLNLLVASINAKSIVNRTVYSFFWGYDDPLIQLSSSYLPGWIDFKRFGLLDRLFAPKREVVTVNLNASAGDVYKIQYWDGSPGLKAWKYDAVENSHPCNTVSGSFEGLMFPPNMDRNQSVSVYRKMFCRNLHLQYNHSRVENGLNADIYQIADDDLTCSNPENVCFCPKKGPCLPDGFIDIGPCFYRLPLAISFPHFYKSDRALVEQFEGLDPQPEKHFTSYSLEPNLGLPLSMTVKVQVNMVLDDLTYNVVAKPFSGMYLPIVWMEARVEGLPSYLIIQMLLAFKYLPVVQVILGWLLSIIGLYLFLYNVFIYIKLPSVSMDMKDPNTIYSTVFLKHKMEKEQSDKLEASSVKMLKTEDLSSEKIEPSTVKMLKTEDEQ